MIPQAGDKGAIIHRYSVNCALPGTYERRSVHKGKPLAAAPQPIPD